MLIILTLSTSFESDNCCTAVEMLDKDVYLCNTDKYLLLNSSSNMITCSVCVYSVLCMLQAMQLTLYSHLMVRKAQAANFTSVHPLNNVWVLFA